MLTICRVFKVVPGDHEGDGQIRFENEADAKHMANLRDAAVGARPGYHRVVPCHVIKAQQEKGAPLVVELGDVVTLV
jgi:hypothetical protein